MTKTNKEKDETTVNSQPDIGSSAPKGFTAVTPQGEGNRAWFKCEPGAVCQGRLVGRFERRDNDGAYYQVQLAVECKAITGKGKEAKTVTLSPGAIVNVDERSAITELQPYADSDGVFNVFIKALEKVDLPGGRTYWRMEAAKEQLKAPTLAIASYKTGSKSSGTDDMGTPF